MLFVRVPHVGLVQNCAVAVAVSSLRRRRRNREVRALTYTHQKHLGPGCLRDWRFRCDIFSRLHSQTGTHRSPCQIDDAWASPRALSRNSECPQTCASKNTRSEVFALVCKASLDSQGRHILLSWSRGHLHTIERGWWAARADVNMVLSPSAGGHKICNVPVKREAKGIKRARADREDDEAALR
jgi:hypothetical protein